MYDVESNDHLAIFNITVMTTYNVTHYIVLFVPFHLSDNVFPGIYPNICYTLYSAGPFIWEIKSFYNNVIVSTMTSQ